MKKLIALFIISSLTGCAHWQVRTDPDFAKLELTAEELGLMPAFIGKKQWAEGDMTVMDAWKGPVSRGDSVVYTRIQSRTAPGYSEQEMDAGHNAICVNPELQPQRVAKTVGRVTVRTEHLQKWCTGEGRIPEGDVCSPEYVSGCKTVVLTRVTISK